MEKSFDDFRLMIVEPPTKLDSKESNILYISLDISSENISDKVISNMVLTHIL